MNESKYEWAKELKVEKTPTFVVRKERLEENLAILDRVQQESGAKILLAQKAFSFWHAYPLLSQTLAGSCASSPHEAQLAYEKFGGEVHSFAAAYSDSDFHALCKVSDHILFNSFSQWERFSEKALEYPRISFGMRVNPQHSEGEVAIYDPCAPHSRLGVTLENFREDQLEGIEGLHFHTLCEQDSFALERTLISFEKQFGHLIPQMKWINFGGGHHITRDDYDVDHLINLIQNFRKRYDNIPVYLEPGEAVALDAGVLIATVLDVVHNGMDIAILDTSATCHMPDVIEMPYRPHIIGSGGAQEKAFTYRLAGQTCLAGDVIGDYSFDKKVAVGDQLIFCDMAIYSMVKTNTFNGIALPSLAYSEGEELCIIKSFTYENFKNRLS